MAAGQRIWATIDRIEYDEQGRPIAVLVFDDGQQLLLPAALLPAGARSKQVLEVSLSVDLAETERRANEVQQLQRELFGEQQ